MDAVEYIKQARRMCKFNNKWYGCGDCALYGRCVIKLDAELTDELIKETVETVEQWAAEHPLMTRWTKLKKQYPTLNDSERKQLCVCALGYKCDCDLNCAKHWDVPVDEEEQE